MVQTRGAVRGALAEQQGEGAGGGRKLPLKAAEQEHYTWRAEASIYEFITPKGTPGPVSSLSPQPLETSGQLSLPPSLDLPVLAVSPHQNQAPCGLLSGSPHGHHSLGPSGPHPALWLTGFPLRECAAFCFPTHQLKDFWGVPTY